MSHWQSGETELKCSLNLLRRALIEVVGEWEGSIVISEEGSLPLYNYQGKKDSKTYNLVVPGCANPNHKKAIGMIYSDMGISKTADGTWNITFDESGMPKKAKNIGGKLKGAVAVLKVRHIAKMGKNKQTAEFSRSGKKYIRILTPVQDKHRIKI